MSAVIVGDDDIIVHYEVLGRGPSVMFLHGWLGSWRYWIPSMQVISSRYRAYAVDLLGFGDSGKQNDPNKYQLGAQTELLFEFLNKLGVAKMAMVGHGLGGAVALNFLRQHPEMVARLMCINTPLNGPMLKPELATTRDHASLLGLANVNRDDDYRAVTTETDKLAIEAVQMAASNMITHDLRNSLTTTHVPSLLVYGDQDPLTPNAEIQPAIDGIVGDSTIHVLTLEGQRHFPMIEDKAKFNRLLLDFLETPGDLSDLALKEEWKRRMR